MDKYIKKDLPVVQRAYRQLVENFPDSRFKMYWEPVTNEFFILTDDFEQSESDEYSQLVCKLYGELMKKTYHRVVIACSSSLEGEEELEMNNFYHSSLSTAGAPGT